MKKELYLAVIAASALMLVFIIGIIITEKSNIEYVRANYSVSRQVGESSTVSIPPVSEKAIQFQKNKVAVWLAGTLLSFLIPALFLFSGVSAGIRDWAKGKSSNMVIAVGLFFIAYSLINYMLSFPLDFYAGFIRLHDYGLSNQTLGKWLGDSLKSLAINTIAGAAFIWVPFVLIKKFPGTWWLYMGLLSIPILVFISFISPVFIDPLFNKYGPIQDKALEAKIHEQLARTTIGDCDVFQVNKSVDTKTMNAYMTGFFNTKRIVLWDTTIEKLSQRETLAVVAHEMGHYVLGHIWKSIMLGGLSCIILLYFVNKCAIWIIGKSGGAFGFNRLYDIAAIPLLILVINIIMFAAAPVGNAYSRYIEKEADRFELELTHDNNAMASSMTKLHWESLSLPKPGDIYKLWVYDHPTFEERVDFANSYKPWAENKPLKFRQYITK